MILRVCDSTEYNQLEQIMTTTHDIAQEQRETAFHSRSDTLFSFGHGGLSDDDGFGKVFIDGAPAK